VDIWWDERAIRELYDLYDYVAADNPSAAVEQVERVYRAVEQLGQFPTIGRFGRVDHTRESVVHGTPYIVVYSIADTNTTWVRILAVLHGARRWPSQF
jgi:plasmid stabilization system protein ParE